MPHPSKRQRILPPWTKLQRLSCLRRIYELELPDGEDNFNSPFELLKRLKEDLCYDSFEARECMEEIFINTLALPEGIELDWPLEYESFRQAIVTQLVAELRAIPKRDLVLNEEMRKDTLRLFVSLQGRFVWTPLDIFWLSRRKHDFFKCIIPQEMLRRFVGPLFDESLLDYFDPSSDNEAFIHMECYMTQSNLTLSYDNSWNRTRMFMWRYLHKKHPNQIVDTTAPTDFFVEKRTNHPFDLSRHQLKRRFKKENENFQKRTGIKRRLSLDPLHLLETERVQWLCCYFSKALNCHLSTAIYAVAMHHPATTLSQYQRQMQPAN